MKSIFYNVRRPICTVSLSLLFFLITIDRSAAQDPTLPVTYPGLDNVHDGFVTPGFYFVNHLQIYNSRSYRNADGHVVPGVIKRSTVLTAYQLLWQSRIQAWGGNLAFSIILPGIKTQPVSSANAVTINDHVAADLLLGCAVQWRGKTFFNSPIHHRIELQGSLPTGAYDKKYSINASAHLYSITASHAVMYQLSEHCRIGIKNNITYHSRILQTATRPGIAYHLNYSAERLLFRNVSVEITGYYLQQAEEDVHEGNHRYYRNIYGITDTKEQLVSIGPGIRYLSTTGFTIEAKAFFETAAKNRFQGSRVAFRLLYQLDR